MKIFLTLLFSAWCWLSASAQMVFDAIDLPHRFGEYNHAYFTTNALDVSSFFGQPGGPRRWDFSQTNFPGESVQRMDLVPASDGGRQGTFPNAAYVERLTNETSGAVSWSYYRVTPGEGRTYYGFYDAVANPFCPLKVFHVPTVDLPDGIYFGRTWARTVDWNDCYNLGSFEVALAVHFTSQASVDAYGTVVLPRIGEVPALRVNEVNTYEVTDLDFGIFNSTSHFRNYYWLVRGIGKAVLIISAPSSTVPPPDFTAARTILRVFEASPRPVMNLRIRQQGAEATLDWLRQTNTSGYRVETRETISATNWTWRGESATNVWTEPLTNGETQRFFRVLLKP